MERSCGTRFAQGNDGSIEDGLFGSLTDTRWLFRAFMPASRRRRECVTTELGASGGRFRLEKRFDGIHRQRKCLEGGRGAARKPQKVLPNDIGLIGPDVGFQAYVLCGTRHSLRSATREGRDQTVQGEVRG